MPPSRILPQCLCDVFDRLHAATRPVVLKAVDALAKGGWLTLTEMARHWPGAERTALPLKALDRLLRSPVLNRERDRLYAAMAKWLIRQSRPLIAVDWSDLKADGSFKLLRAGLVVQGRTLTLWEEVHPRKSSGTPAVERAFLQHLAKRLPAGTRPIVLTDAGFRRPWFQAVRELGWDYVGRLRGRVQVQPYAAHADDHDQWVWCSALHAQAPKAGSCNLGRYRIGWRAPWDTRLILHRARRKHRHALTRQGTRRHDRANEDAARSGREPWVLVTSLREASATQVASYYARRMTIEQGFRDLKSDVYGAGLEHSLTRKGNRLANLLLIFALHQFAAWLVGLCEEHERGGWRLETSRQPRRRHYSTMRLGVEILKRPRWWPPPCELKSFLRRFAHECPTALTCGIAA